MLESLLIRKKQGAISKTTQTLMQLISWEPYQNVPVIKVVF